METETCYANGISKDQYNYDTETGKISRYHHLEWYEILFAIGIAAVCGGAHLTCEGSPMLEDLKVLEAEGVEILTCGTCLNFYGLTEKLRIGTVTNMYVIAEKMLNAGNVVKP